MIAHDPLHGSGRAALPHPALALGDDAEAHEGIWMADDGRRKPSVDVPTDALPGHSVLLAAAPQGAVPKPSDCPSKRTYGGAIHGHSKVPDMPAHNRAQV